MTTSDWPILMLKVLIKCQLRAIELGLQALGEPQHWKKQEKQRFLVVLTIQTSSSNQMKGKIVTSNKIFQAEIISLTCSSRLN